MIRSIIYTENTEEMIIIYALYFYDARKQKSVQKENEN